MTAHDHAAAFKDSPEEKAMFEIGLEVRLPLKCLLEQDTVAHMLASTHESRACQQYQSERLGEVRRESEEYTE